MRLIHHVKVFAIRKLVPFALFFLRLTVIVPYIAALFLYVSHILLLEACREYHIFRFQQFHQVLGDISPPHV